MLIELGRITFLKLKNKKIKTKKKTFKTNRWIIIETDYHAWPGILFWVCNYFGRKLEIFLIHRNKSEFST